MILGAADYIVFAVLLLFLIYTIVRNLLRRQSADEFYRAGGKVHWAMIGMSLIAADMSLEYIVVSSASGYTDGLAIGSYEWTASIALIFVALYIVPRYMRAGVLTIPEYLELRYDKYARLILSILFIVIYIIANLTSILYSSAMIMQDLFGVDTTWLVWLVGAFCALLILSGGMFSVLRTDFIFATLLLIGGAAFAYFSLVETGGFDAFVEKAGTRLDAVKPADDAFLPWTQVFLGGLWVLHFSYWGFNQFITQKYMISSSLSEAQKGILFAATLKLIIPFLFVFPGIVGFELFSDKIPSPDHTFSVLLQEVIPAGIKGVMMVTFLGTIIAASEAVFSALSNIFGHDIYKKFINPEASQKQMMNFSRVCVVLSVIAACLLSPQLAHSRDIFTYVQHVNSAFAPGLVAVFVFAFYVKKAPRISGAVGLISSIAVYTVLLWNFPDMQLMTLTILNFASVAGILVALTLLFPLKEAVVIPDKNNVRFERNLIVIVWSVFIITAVAAIYTIFL